MAELCWLLERKAESRNAYDEIFLGVENGKSRWHKDANKALRFTRKEDAENCWGILQWTGELLSQTKYRPVLAQQHMFECGIADA